MKTNQELSICKNCKIRKAAIWKPSKTQLEALIFAKGGYKIKWVCDALERLCNDLKKLREL